MGPSHQAPGHLSRLHDIVVSEANLFDKLGAACVLVCIYERARWSDLRYIERAYIAEGESLTWFTAEHKTAAVGLRRQQYLPIVVPWQGIASDDWMPSFLQLYATAGLNINKQP